MLFRSTREIVWLRRSLSDMGVSLSNPSSMYCDNKSAIQIAHNFVFHKRTKYIEIDCHITHHYLKHGAITFPFVYSSAQIADLFIKSHPIQHFPFLVGKLSMLLVAA